MNLCGQACVGTEEESRASSDSSGTENVLRKEEPQALTLDDIAHGITIPLTVIGPAKYVRTFIEQATIDDSGNIIEVTGTTVNSVRSSDTTTITRPRGRITPGRSSTRAAAISLPTSSLYSQTSELEGENSSSFNPFRAGSSVTQIATPQTSSSSSVATSDTSLNGFCHGVDCTTSITPSASPSAEPPETIIRLDSDSLSKGAIAAISLGVILAIVIASGIALLVCRRNCGSRSLPHEEIQSSRQITNVRQTQPHRNGTIEPYRIEEFDRATWDDEVATLRKYNSFGTT